MSRFVPLRVNVPQQKVFTEGWNWQECAVMDRREEHALNEVDRIALAVQHLRDLLLAATKADLRAMSKQPAAEGPPR
jgi:hypothetical protein